MVLDITRLVASSKQFHKELIGVHINKELSKGL